MTLAFIFVAFIFHLDQPQKHKKTGWFEVGEIHYF